MLKTLTKTYIKAFNDKDLKGVEALLDEDFILEDPAVKRIEGKQKALGAIESIFSSCENLSFSAKNIYEDGQTTFIEFILKLDEVRLEGVDILEWKEGKIKECRAYLDLPK
ncbi:nuclear transport factor 2 family protein [Campylobacter vulpis]|uniref:Ketosteroid isomerase n=1 Tax=Campylobacter vulpis TaxID=1655500 RepID=A0A2G4QYU5_9BACT|nr:nuclear transport factor 2 family protein [Campylobacter vulpis]MBS4235909.1 nuclear transport factor 2 family protein [Campylobacter vulpis]MBS4240960.1 nuclear transport factor 2 family protein [Campylobacter vulpis]MBS4252873.1 nuclear transport factor 2 family protein [Campylobacter vulpis]MBS4269212.1 nuclear transport factor 2 family protein [Campylobacter vulpis]MBS4282160.1 nuclear transport factor 2 family protein [Campylobacter vulpis]